jgi:nuclear pore complex protein Nup205
MTNPWILVHYFPPLGACIARYGGIEGGGTMADARSLNNRFFAQPDQNSWPLSYLQAAFRAWWLAEYSGWYGENADGSIPDNQLDDGRLSRYILFLNIC